MIEAQPVFVFTNDTSKTITVFIEPWAEEIKIQKNQELKIHDTENKETFEIVYLESGICLYGLTEKHSIYRNNEKIY